MGDVAARRAEAAGLGALALCFACVNVVWISRFRVGKPLDIDEAGYLGLSLSDYHALVGPGGVLAWWHAVDAPSIYAPLMMAFSSLSYLLLGPNEFTGFLCPVFFGIFAVVASYLLGKQLGGVRLGFVSAVLVATSPGIVNAAREYNYAIPAAAVTTATVLALVRSQRFTSIGWSVAFGVLLGLLPLSRSMCIAFVPGISIAAVSQVLTGQERVKRAGIMLGSLVLGGLVAATWLIRSGPLVWHYLVSFGYGAASLSTGRHRENLLSFGAWRETLGQILAYDYLPHVMVLLLGGGALLAIVIRGIRAGGWRRAASDAADAPILPAIVVLVEGLLMLTSTGNKGTGFIVTFLPLMLVVAAWALFAISRGSPTVSSATVAMAIFFSLPLLDVSLPWALPWTANVPFVGSLTITDGRALIQRWEGAMDQSTAAAWRAANRWTSQQITEHAPDGVRTGLGFQDPFLNSNTVSFERWLLTAGGDGHTFYPPLDPSLSGDSVTGYTRWLRDPVPTPVCLLLTEDGATRQYGVPISSRIIEEAARRTGFVPVGRRTLPDGAILTVRRSASNCGA